MENLNIFLGILSATIGLILTKEVFTTSRSNVKKREAQRFFTQMSDAQYENPEIKASVYTRGLTLAKKKMTKSIL